MALRYSLIHDLRPGRIDWKIKVRVSRLYIILDREKVNEINSINMLLIDEKGDKIHAIIKKEHVAYYKELLKEGVVYIFQHLLVVGNTYGNFRPSTYEYKLNFIRKTIVTETIGDDIPLTSFQFTSFDEILIQGSKTYLIDVIGHLCEKHQLKEGEKNGKAYKLIEIVMEDLEKKRLKCTLWGAFADQLCEYLHNQDPSKPVIMILQLAQTILDEDGRVTGISSFYYGTKLFINPDLKEVVEYRDKLLNGGEPFTQVIHEMSSQSSLTMSETFLQSKRMTICDLIHSKEEGNVALIGKIIEIENLNNWSYEACSKHLVKVGLKEGRFYCTKCVDFVTVVPCFRLKVTVIDDTESASFVLFDRFVRQLIGKTAKDIILSSKEGYPTDFDVILEKELLFKVQINSDNINRMGASYTVTKVSNDEKLIAAFKDKYSIKEVDEEVVETTVEHYVGDSLEDLVFDENNSTPTSKKPSNKRLIDDDNVSLAFDDDTTQSSSTKLSRNVKVKTESGV